MLSQQGGHETAESREDTELSSQENTAGPKETPRRHVDALLDISEENSMKGLEPYEYHDPSEHAVWGWTRVAPLSCLLMAQKNHRKPKHKEVENHTPLCVDSIGPRANSPASVKGQHGESRVGLSNCKKPVSANQQIDSSGPTKRPVLNVMQEDMTRFLLKEKTEESLLKITPWRPCHLSSQYSVPENPHTKPQKHSHKPTNKALPGKSSTFSPPIQSPRINPGSCHVCRGKAAPNGENPEQNFFMFNRKSAARRTGVDIVANPDLCVYSAAPTSECHTSHHKPHLFSTLSLLKKNQLLMSPTSGTALPTSYSVDKSISQAVLQTRIPPRCLS